MQYEELRDRYPVFVFENYTVSFEGDGLEIVYDFSIPGLARFSPAWSFGLIGSRRRPIDRQCLDRLVFSLGMVELISYWKICCPPRVNVECGALDETQKRWWKKLYIKGLGEYFYKNSIMPDDGFMDILCPLPQKPATVAATRADTFENPPKVLVPIGGGKDSAVALELLRGTSERYVYIINPRQASIDTVAASGIRSENVIVARRTLDKNMLLLNERGFLNGHTPFSAIVAFSSVLAGYINGMDYVALANESSANETTVANSDVNHQYSKSFEFEMDFRRYELDHIGSGVEYFSLLRPLLELQIARLFSDYTQYHPVFRSCNAASKRDEWCGVCPKCLFVYIILSPFLAESELISIFGKNIFEDSSLIPTLDELAGFSAEKPFECVGQRDEVRAALELAIAKYDESARPLPPLLTRYKDKRGEPFDADKVLAGFDTENAVPPAFLATVIAAVGRI